MGAYVKLLEYDNIDGMILLSELSRRRIRSIQKLIRIGRNEVVIVLRVDKEKGMDPRQVRSKSRSLTHGLYRIYRSVEASCLPRRCYQVRRAIQQEQGGSLYYAPRRRGHSSPTRGALPADRLATQQEIWPLPRCVQDRHHVCPQSSCCDTVLMLINFF